MAYSDLLDLDTLSEIRKAAPKVTNVSFNIARDVTLAMDEHSKKTKANLDREDKMYWQTRIKDLHNDGKFDETITLNQIGRALKAMGMQSWRKNDGFHVAWSSEQLEILKAYFKA